MAPWVVMLNSPQQVGRSRFFALVKYILLQLAAGTANYTRDDSSGAQSFSSNFAFPAEATPNPRVFDLIQFFGSFSLGPGPSSMFRKGDPATVEAEELSCSKYWQQEVDKSLICSHFVFSQ